MILATSNNLVFTPIKGLTPFREVLEDDLYGSRRIGDVITASMASVMKQATRISIPY